MKFIATDTEWLVLDDDDHRIAAIRFEDGEHTVHGVVPGEEPIYVASTRLAAEYANTELRQPVANWKEAVHV